MTEEWRDINGFEGFYQVSNLGRVRSLDRFAIREQGVPHHLKGKVLSAGTDRWGYRFVILQNGRKLCRMVHKLVAEAFIEKKKDGLVINHIDGDKSNNSTANLEYCTQSENMLHAVRTGLVKTNPVVMMERLTGNELRRFASISDAQRFFGSNNSSNICNALNGRSKTAYGYLWKYENE